MIKKKTNIWIWLQNGKLFKAISNTETGTITIYDENNRQILKREGLSRLQVREIEINLIKYGAKKLNEQTKPFEFL